MALSRANYGGLLRTISGSTGSKAPMQNVSLPTNRSAYKTPSMKTTTTSASAGGQPVANATNMARMGGILGKIGKNVYNDKFNPDNKLEALQERFGVKGNFGAGTPLDTSEYVAAQAAEKAYADSFNPQFQMMGNIGADSGLPNASETANAFQPQFELTGNIGQEAATEAGRDVFQNVAAEAGTDAAANGAMSAVPVGTLLSIGNSAANGDMKKAAMTAGGAAVGGVVPGVGVPIGAMLGSILSGYV